MRRTTTTFAVLVVALLAPLLVSAASAQAALKPFGEVEATYQVEIINTTEGQYLTPPNWVAHNGLADVFERGEAASPGVEAVAERGDVPVLAAELSGAVDDAGLGVSGVAGDAPIAPGESVSFEFTTSELRFSVVSMIICTNDGFGGVDSVRLPLRDGASRTYGLRDYDAGVEQNTENRADLVPAPFCNGEGGTGDPQPELDENGTISPHPGITGAGDLPESFDWPGRRVGSVRVTRVAETPSYTVDIENIAGGQYLTPPNWAAHSNRVDVWSPGRPASEGVAAVAEVGGVDVLAAELAAAVDDAGYGVSGVGADAPIGPGGTATFDFETTERRFSLVSMLICTNDGFGGLDSVVLPRFDGDTVTFYARAWDAGTELNTENRADIVPAPFCNGEGGTGENQPELDGDLGRITHHQSLRGVGDMPESFDWDGPVIKVTISRDA